MKTHKENQTGQISSADCVAEALVHLCLQDAGRHPDRPETWPSTRDIAEYSFLGIYKTRYLLLKMVKSGQARVTPHPINNALRWYRHSDANST